MPIPLDALRRASRRVRYGKPIVVVTGLPRSGTSMMMQMLAAGGVEPITDGLREADESNPHGYYELERVKDLEKTVEWDWLAEARGRAVKVIAYLMRFLPQTFNYKVVFMQRQLDEVLASQSRMLSRLGETLETDDAHLRTLFIDHLARTKSLLQCRPCFEVLHVPYAEVIGDAAGYAEKVRRFVGGDLDTVAMAEAVRPDLHRNRR